MLLWVIWMTFAESGLIGPKPGGLPLGQHFGSTLVILLWALGNAVPLVIALLRRGTRRRHDK